MAMKTLPLFTKRQKQTLAFAKANVNTIDLELSCL